MNKKSNKKKLNIIIQRQKYELLKTIASGEDWDIERLTYKYININIKKEEKEKEKEKENPGNPENN